MHARRHAHSAWSPPPLPAAEQGRGAATRQFAQELYADLRMLAARYFRGQPADHTLQPTALVHETYLRIMQRSHRACLDRVHFFALAATAMRQILVDHAARRSAAKRGRGLRIAEDPGNVATHGLDWELLALDEALRALHGVDPRKSKVVELRFFGGLTIDEIAHVLHVSKRTVEYDWHMARAWLSRALCEGR